MKVLWITNIVFPEAQKLLRGEGNLKASGGWMIGAAEALISIPDIELTVATVSNEVKRLSFLKGNNVTYVLLPYGKGNIRVNQEYEPLWQEVRDVIRPDIVHLHGTELTHGLAYINSCGSDNVCVSIQGLVSAYYYYYYLGLTKKKIILSSTIRSVEFGGILGGYKSFKKRSKSEISIIKQINHVIGRTSWDKERVWAINPNAKYHYGGETLRKEFYGEKIWNYEKCNHHSIFLSQATYPIKGLHMVLRAMPLILRHYPDTLLRIAGNDITKVDNLKDYLLLTDYGRLIKKIIKKLNLQNHVVFTGPLNGAEMCEEYLRCNVFVCPSSIENSPNSLGEAQILGVPVVASYVGGVPDMMRGDEGHLYRFEEIEMLAYKVVEIFNAQAKINTHAMREEAIKRHNPRENAAALYDIYCEIINNRDNKQG